MFKMLGLATAIGVQIATPGMAQGLDPEVTMRPMVILVTGQPPTVRELLALPESASDIARERSADGLARANENRTRAAEDREGDLQRARERRGAVVGMAAEARERRVDFSDEIAEAARSVRESVVRGGGIDLPMLESLLGPAEHVPARPVGRPVGPVLPDRSDASEQTDSGT